MTATDPKRSLATRRGISVKPGELNDWLGVITNAGVVAGLIMVAYQIHQNNIAMEHDARIARVANGNPRLKAVIMEQLDRPGRQYSTLNQDFRDRVRELDPPEFRKEIPEN